VNWDFFARPSAAVRFCPAPSPPAKAVFYGVVFGTLQALIVNYWLGTYDVVTLHLVTLTTAVEYLLFMIALVLLIRICGAWGFLGYPWDITGASQYRFLPLIQIASVTGVWGVSFVVLACTAGAFVSRTVRRVRKGVRPPEIDRSKRLSRCNIRSGGVQVRHRDDSRYYSPVGFVTLPMNRILRVGTSLMKNRKG
jgi:apolipoprotein N-acyltransferase